MPTELMDNVIVLPEGALLYMVSGLSVAVSPFDDDEEDPTFTWSVLSPSGCLRRGQADSPEDAIKAALLTLAPQTILVRPEDT